MSFYIGDENARRAGKIGGPVSMAARLAKLSDLERQKLAKKAARARWGPPRRKPTTRTCPTCHGSGRVKS